MYQNDTLSVYRTPHSTRLCGRHYNEIRVAMLRKDQELAVNSDGVSDGDKALFLQRTSAKEEGLHIGGRPAVGHVSPVKDPAMIELAKRKREEEGEGWQDEDEMNSVAGHSMMMASEIVLEEEDLALPEVMLGICHRGLVLHHSPLKLLSLLIRV